MILFFHFIFLVTKYIFNNLSKSFSKSQNESECSGSFCSNIGSQLALSTFSAESKYLDGKLKFFPPVYVQRYEAVYLILQEPPWKDTVRKIVDFGCAQLGFFLYLKNMSGIEEILEVDIDESILTRFSNKAAPLNSDHLFCKRSKPLDVYILAGDISEYDDHLLGADVVVAIEVIEHLKPETLRKVPHNIFHNITPRLAIFTTPNADFNVLFHSEGFRHDDHQFEWSRKEFYNWTKEITDRYQNYTVKFYGVGAGPEGTENLGCCTQMAVFERRDSYVLDPNDLNPKGIHNYKLLCKYEYPFYVDKRTDEEKIIDEVYYRLKFSINKHSYSSRDEYEYEIPLSEFMDYVKKWCSDVEQLKSILIDHGFVVRLKDESYVLLYVSSGSGSSAVSVDTSEEFYINTPPKFDEISEDWDCEEDENHTRESDLNEDEVPGFMSARSMEEMMSQCENMLDIMESSTPSEAPKKVMSQDTGIKVSKVHSRRVRNQAWTAKTRRSSRNLKNRSGFNVRPMTTSTQTLMQHLLPDTEKKKQNSVGKSRIIFLIIFSNIAQILYFSVP